MYPYLDASILLAGPALRCLPFVESCAFALGVARRSASQTRSPSRKPIAVDLSRLSASHSQSTSSTTHTAHSLWAHCRFWSMRTCATLA
eukprot:4406106-Pleurochrysis_carterae.AAC.7